MIKFKVFSYEHVKINIHISYTIFYRRKFKITLHIHILGELYFFFLHSHFIEEYR